MANHTLRKSIRSLAVLAARAPQLQEVFGRLGDHRRRRRAGNVARQAGLLGAGLVLGAGLTTLFAPVTGEKVRQRLSERATRIRESIAPRAEGAARGTSRNRRELS